MTPDQIAGLTAVATIFSKIGTWPIGSVVAIVVLGPWIFSYLSSRAQEKRHEAVIKMYEDNVKLVQGYENMAGDYQGIVVLNTQSMTKVNEKIDNNHYCPMMRKYPIVEKQP